MASAEHPEGEKMHITAYGAIIHAEDVAVHPHIRSGKQLVTADLLLGECVC